MCQVHDSQEKTEILYQIEENLRDTTTKCNSWSNDSMVLSAIKDIIGTTVETQKRFEIDWTVVTCQC